MSQLRNPQPSAVAFPAKTLGVTSILKPQFADPSATPRERTPRLPSNRRWVGFGVYAALLIACFVLQDRVSALTSTAIGGLGFIPLNFGAIYWLWKASSNPSHSEGERSGLRLLAAMFGLTAVGNLGYAVESFMGQRSIPYGWTNVPYLLTYPVGAFALSRFPITPRGLSEWRKQLLDLLCILIAIIVLVWTFVIVRVDLQLDRVQLAITLAYPVLCAVLLAFVGRLLVRQASNDQHHDFALLAAALFVQCTVDLVLELDFRNAGSPLASWSAVICPLAYVLIIAAAERSSARTESGPTRPRDPSLVPVNLLPTLAAISVYGVLIWAAQSDQREPLAALVAAAIALNLLFLAKQSIAVHENARLLAARAEAESRARYEEVAREGQKLEAVGRLAGGIAHDFNNLLTTMLANSEFALSRLRPGELAFEEVSDIRGAATRGADLIRQLLAFSRKSVIATVRLQPDLVLHDMERLLQRLAGDRCGLLLDLRADLGTVQMDRGQLEQVIANLVANARDAMPDGGAIVISGRNVALDAARASSLALPVGDYVAIAVQDNGIGIPADVRARIFEPFFSTKGRGKGTGLGLASAYGIMRQSNGAIEVQSAPGQGSCFTLFLPRVYVDVANRPLVPAIAADVAPAGRNATILLVEDEVAVRQVTRRILESEGYAVLTASDAVAARAIFEQHGDAIALMITDVMMPGESGLDLAAHLRQRWPNLVVIFISGYSNSELPDDGALAADDEFVQKPFTGAQLLARVDARLRGTHRPLPTSDHNR